MLRSYKGHYKNSKKTIQTNRKMAKTITFK